MKKIVILFCLISSFIFCQNLLLPSQVKDKQTNQQTQTIQKDNKLTSEQKQTLKSQSKTTTTQKPSKQPTQTHQQSTKATIKQIYPVDEQTLEKTLLYLQQQIVIEKKKNELLKLQKENLELENQKKTYTAPPQPLTPTPLPTTEQPRYSYIAGESLPQSEEIEVVSVSPNLIVVRDNGKYYYLRQGAKFKNLEILKISPEGIIVKQQDTIKTIGFSYQPPEKEVISFETKTEKK